MSQRTKLTLSYFFLLAFLAVSVVAFIAACSGRSGSSGSLPGDGGEPGQVTTIRTKVALAYNSARAPSKSAVEQMEAEDATYRSAEVKLTLPDGRVLVMSYDGAGEYSCKVENLPSGSAGFIQAELGGVVVKNFFDRLAATNGAMDAGLTNPDSTLAADVLATFAQALAPVDGGYSVGQLLTGIQGATLDIDVTALRTQVENGEIAGYELARQTYNSMLTWDNVDLSTGDVQNVIVNDPAVVSLNQQIAAGGLKPPLRTNDAEAAKLVVSGYFDAFYNLRAIGDLSPYLSDTEFLHSGDDKSAFLLALDDDWSNDPLFVNLSDVNLSGISYASTPIADFDQAKNRTMFLVTYSGAYDLRYADGRVVTRIIEGGERGLYVGKDDGEWMIFGDRKRMWLDYSVGYFNTSDSGTFTELRFKLGNSGNYTPSMVQASNAGAFGGANPISVPRESGGALRYSFTMEGSQETTWAYLDRFSYVPTELSYLDIDSKIFTITATYPDSTVETYTKTIQIKDPTTTITGFTQSEDGSISLSWRPPLIEAQLLSVELRLVDKGLILTLPASERSGTLSWSELSTAGLASGDYAAIDVVYLTDGAEIAARQSFQYRGRTVLPVVAAPTFTPAPGPYATAQSVSIDCGTSGATIIYTDDGSIPSPTNGTQYVGAITVSQTKNIRAIGIKTGMTGSPVAEGLYSITSETAPSITTATLTNGLLGVSYSQTVAASGGRTPYLWTVSSGTLPGGLGLNINSGIISGTPNATGTFSFTVRCTGANNLFTTANLSITIQNPPNITTTSLASGALGVAYSQTVAATGGLTPFTWSISSGTQPTSLGINSITGEISGTPSATGTFNFTVRCTGYDGLYDEQALSVTIGAAPSISPSTLPNGTRDVAYSQTVSATGGTTPYVWSISSGALPAGLGINSSTGAITGTPTATGDFTFTVRCANAGANPLYAERSFTVSIATPVVPNPTFSPVSGTNFTTSLDVTVTNTGTTLFYRLNGSIYQSTNDASVVLNLADTTTLDAYATRTGWTQSSTATATYYKGSPFLGIARVSVATDDTQSDGDSRYPFISTDGRYVAFTSAATTFATPNVAGINQVFLRDRQTNTTERVSVNTSGAPANYYVYNPSVSADGRYVSFDSEATNLVAGDTNGRIDTFLRDRTNSTTVRVNVATDGTQANDTTDTANISADGRFIVFRSLATNLVAGDTNGTSDIFQRDIPGATTTRINLGPLGVQGNGVSFSPVISADGGVIAYGCFATNLVAGDTNNNRDIFVYTKADGSTTRVNVATDGTQANGASGNPAISGDGKLVAFDSDATNLVAGDTNARYDVFVRDLTTGVTRRVSVSSTGTQGNGDSQTPNISADGRYVTFISDSTNLTGETQTGNRQAYRHDLTTGATILLSMDSSNVTGDNSSQEPRISANGTTFAFASYSSNLVASDTNGRLDIFVVGPSFTPNPPSITTTSLNDAALGVAYSQTLAAEGGVIPLTWTLETGTLPIGISLSPSGTLSGTCGYDGVSNFTVRVTGANGLYDTQALSLTVTGAPSITTSTLPLAVYNVAYSQTLSASGGVAPITWSILSGSLPPNYSIDSSSGTISGTSTTFGDYDFTVKALGANGLFATRSYRITLTMAPFITTNTLPGGTVGSAYSWNIYSEAGTDIGGTTWSHVAGTLPTGLALTNVAEGGRISGTPTASGDFTFTVRATGGNGLYSEKQFTMNIAGVTPPAAPPTFETPNGETYFTGSMQVTMRFGDGQTLWYRTGGTGSYTSSTSSPTLLTVTSTTLVEAYTTQSGYTQSSTVSRTYTLGAAVLTRLNVMTATTNNGVPANDSARLPFISADGKYLTFASLGSNLTPASPYWQTYIKNLTTGETRRVSTKAAGDTADGNSFSYATISADGRYVAFISSATNLLPGVTTSGFNQLYRKDLHTGEVVMVSVDSTGAEPSFSGAHSAPVPWISADGNRFVFTSTGSLSPQDGDAVADVYMRDINAGTTTLISVPALSAKEPSSSTSTYMTPDGRYVVFFSGATNLVSGDTNATSDVFLRDTQTLTTTRVSLNTGGTQVAGSSMYGTVSDDARYVAFTSSSTDLSPGLTGTRDQIIIYDRQTQTAKSVSKNSSGDYAGTGCYQPMISGNGRYVTFTSTSANIYSTNASGLRHVYMLDLLAENIFPVDIDGSGNWANASTYNDWFSRPTYDGRYVTFSSKATNLDGYSLLDRVFVHDMGAPSTTPTITGAGGATTFTASLQITLASTGGGTIYYSTTGGAPYAQYSTPFTISGTTNVKAYSVESGKRPSNLASVNFTKTIPLFTERASSNAAGETAIGSSDWSSSLSFSKDGRYVTFTSFAANLVAGDTNAKHDVFVKDRSTGEVWLISKASDGTLGNNDSYDSSISYDGRYVVFESNATNLVSGDTNAATDIFLHDRSTGLTKRVSVGTGGTQLTGRSGHSRISGNGSHVAFMSMGTLTGITDTNGWYDIMVYDVANQTTTYASLASGGTATGNYGAMHPSISEDGRYVAFDNLVTADPDMARDVVVRDRQAGTTTLVGSGLGDLVMFSTAVMPVISGDGSMVAFRSGKQIYARQVTGGTGTDILVSATTSGGANSSYNSYRPMISGNGRYVVFVSAAPDLTTGDVNGFADVFVRDLQTSATTLYSVHTSGAQADAASYYAAINYTGEAVAFVSPAGSLVDSGNRPAQPDVFVRSPGTPPAIVAQSVPSQAVGYTYNLTLAGAGGTAPFTFTVDSGALPTGLSLSSGGTITGTASASGVYNFNLRVTDANGLSTTKAFGVEIVPVMPTLVVSVDSSQNFVPQPSLLEYPGPAVSYDGRFVAFASTGAFDVNDGNSADDIYLRDNLTNLTIPVSRDTAGDFGASASYTPSISSDGKHVAFTSNNALVSADTNGFADIYLWNANSGAVTLLSTSTGGALADSNSFYPAISGDGRYVAFYSSSTNLVSGAVSQGLYRHDSQTGTTILVSQTTTGTATTGNKPALSSDGNLVAFESSSSSIVSGDTNVKQDVFVRNVSGASSSRASVSTGGAQANDHCYAPAMSADGRYVAFLSYATNLVPNDTNVAKDAFVRDTVAGTTTRVSVPYAGGEADDDTMTVSISADGRYVAFASYATNMGAPSDASLHTFLHDRNTGITKPIGLVHNSYLWGTGDDAPIISGDGSRVVFHSNYNLYNPSITNSTYNVLIHGPAFGAGAALPPVFSPEPRSYSGAQTVSLTTGTSLASIYYTTNNTQPTTSSTLYTGTPINVSATTTIRAIAVKSGLADSPETVGTFTITVPPAITISTLPGAAQDIAYSQTVSASGGTGPFTWTVASGSLPTGLNLDPATGAITGTPTTPGSYTFTLRCTDANGLYGEASYTVTIGPPRYLSLVSVDNSGVVGNAHSSMTASAMSADGRFVVFDSPATNLVPGDTNSMADVFVRDRLMGTTTRVSVANDGSQGTGSSYQGSISADGRYVAFLSYAIFSVNDTNGTSSIYVHDRQTGMTTLASRSSAGVVANGSSDYPVISGNGRYVAYNSESNNLVFGDTNGYGDVFRTDLQTGATVLVSHSSGGSFLSAASGMPSISYDGNLVLYTSNGANIVAGDTNSYADHFVTNMTTNNSVRVNLSSTGAQDNVSAPYGTAFLSSNGNYVAYSSGGTTVVPGDTNAAYDCFLRDLVNNTTTRVSVGNTGNEGNLHSYAASISADGQSVLFNSSATNLVTSPSVTLHTTYLRNVTQNTTTLESVADDGTLPNATIQTSAMSSDGQHVAFRTTANNIGAGAGNTYSQIYARGPVLGAGAVRPVTFSLPPRAYNPPQTLTLATTTSGATIYYTLDDTQPTTSSTQFTGTPIEFNSLGTVTVRAIAIKSGLADSPESKATYTIAGFTERVSVSSAGAQATGAAPSTAPRASDDGRYVVFSTAGTNLVAGDINGSSDIFVRDRLTGQTTRVSVASDGTEANGNSNNPSITGDGRYVAFESLASNLVSGDTNGVADVFMHDRQTGTTTRVSTTSAGAQIAAASQQPMISRLGTHVVFGTTATGLGVTDSYSYMDIFVKNISTGGLACASLNLAGTSTDIGNSNEPVISGDGRYVAFASNANGLVASDTNSPADIFRRDMTSGTTTRVNVTSTGVQASGGTSYTPSISDDGQSVVFWSAAMNLVASDTNLMNDVFLRKYSDNTTTRISVGPSGAEANGNSGYGVISGNGNFVSFLSDATNIVPSDSNTFNDIFVRDLAKGTTTIASVSSGNASSNGAVTYSAINYDGSQVIFHSAASNLVANDTNGIADIFARGPALGAGAVSPVAFSTPPRTYPTAQSVALTTSTSGASIYYTLNDTPPTTSSTQYDGTPLSVSAGTVATTTTIRAIAVKSGLSDSPETKGAFTILAPPSITVSSLPGGASGTAYNQTVTATGGSAPYIWSKTAGRLPDGLALNSATGAITGTPTSASIFSFTLRVAGADGLFSEQPLAIVVDGSTNNAPVLAAITTPRSGAEAGAISFSVSATDADAGDTLTFSLVNSPAGATLANNGDRTASFAWTPGYSDSGSYTVTFRVFDGTLYATQDVTFNISNTNRAPVLNAIGAKSGSEGTPISFTVTGSDPDGTTPTFALVTPPTGATINSTTGLFAWTPSYTQSGTTNITFRISDGLLFSSEVVAFTIANTNRAPAFTYTVGTKTGKLGTAISFTLTSSDADNDTRTYTMTNAPYGATLNASTGAFSWTPGIGQTGNFTVTFTVSDGTTTATQDGLFQITDSSAIPTLVNLTPAGVPATGGGAQPSLSGDGRYIAYVYYGTDILPLDNNTNSDVYVKDLVTGVTTLGSVNTSGGLVTGTSHNSTYPSFSTDGSYLAMSIYGNVDGVFYTSSEIYRNDRLTPTIVRASVPPAGGSSGGSYFSSISGDGRYIVFESNAKMTSGANDDATSVASSDIYLKDMNAGTITLLSGNYSGYADATVKNSTDDSTYARISRDGRYVVFMSTSRMLAPGITSGRSHIYIWSRDTGTTTLVAAGVGGVEPNSYEYNPVISADGRFVAFRTASTNMGPTDANGANNDILVKDMETGVLENVHKSSAGVQANNTAMGQPAISDDGRYVVFFSGGSNLVIGETISGWSIYLHDRLTRTTKHLDLNWSGARVTGGAYYQEAPSISGDGRYVAFMTEAALAQADTDFNNDLYVVDNGPLAAQPVISTPGNATTFDTTLDITLTNPNANATGIMYSTDGGATWLTYAGTPITVSATTTVKACAIAAGMRASYAAEATYTKTAPP